MFTILAITIMSFNIRTATPNDGTNAWDYRKEACVAMIDSIYPDVLGMQEVTPKMDAYLQDNLIRYDHVMQGRRPGMKADEGCPIYWRKDKYELIQTRTFWLSETPQVMSKGWDAAFERVATYVVLKNKKSGKQMIVFNTHLDHIGVQAREQSMRMMADTLKVLGNKRMPMFVMGDMNVFPDDPSIAPIYEYMHWSQKEAKQTTQENTFTGFDNSGNRIIDYIFYRNACAKKFEVIHDTTRVPYLSDHRPVMATFKVK